MQAFALQIADTVVPRNIHINHGKRVWKIRQVDAM